MILLPLFWSFFQIGLFSVGGGYAAMPLIRQQVVEINPWLSMVQFADIMTIAEMTPGPIAINCATFAGMRIAGLPGALIATLGCVLPSAIIVMLLAYLYNRFKGLGVVQGILRALRPAVLAMIASAGISLLLLSLYGSKDMPEDFLKVDWIAFAIFALSLAFLRVKKPKPVLVIFACGALGIALYSILPTLA